MSLVKNAFGDPFHPILESRTNHATRYRFCNWLSLSGVRQKHIHWRSRQKVGHLSSENRAPGCLGVYRGWNPSQLCGDYFINHEIRIPIQQPGFHGKEGRFFFSWLIFLKHFCLEIPRDGNCRFFPSKIWQPGVKSMKGKLYNVLSPLLILDLRIEKKLHLFSIQKKTLKIHLQGRWSDQKMLGPWVSLWCTKMSTQMMDLFLPRPGKYGEFVGKSIFKSLNL